MTAKHAPTMREALEKLVSARENLPLENYRAVERWINEVLNPAITEARAALSQAEPETQDRERLIADLIDLHRQATTERSHYYVASVVRRCIAALGRPDNSTARGSEGHRGATESTGSASTDAAVRPAVKLMEGR